MRDTRCGSHEHVGVDAVHDNVHDTGWRTHGAVNSETCLTIYGLKPGLHTPNSHDNPFVVRPLGREHGNVSPMYDLAEERRRGQG